MAAQRSSAVSDILSSASQFSESSIKELEGHVRDQVSKGTYDKEANVALVKLYQANPDRCDSDVLGLALIKAMMFRDSTSMRLMVPDYLVESSPVLEKICECDALLEASDFKKFWQVENGQLEALVSGFSAALRQHILSLFSAAFSTVEVDLVATALGTQRARDVEELCGDAAQVDGSFITFKPNAHNQPRQQQTKSQIKSVGLDALLSLYQASDEDQQLRRPQ